MLHFKLLFLKSRYLLVSHFKINKYCILQTAKLCSALSLYRCMFIPSYCQHEKSCYSHKFEQNN